MGEVNREMIEFVDHYQRSIREIAISLVGVDSPHFDVVRQEMKTAILELLHKRGDYNKSYILNRAKRRALDYLKKERLWERRSSGEYREDVSDEEPETPLAVDEFMRQAEKTWRAGGVPDWH